MSRPQEPRQESRPSAREPSQTEPEQAKPGKTEARKREARQRGRFSLSLFIFLLASLLAPLLHAGAEPIDISKLERLTLDQADYMVSDRPLSLSEAPGQNFTAFSSETVNQGISKCQHWLHFSLHNSADTAVGWILRGETTYLDNLVIWARDDVAAEFRQLHLTDRAPFGTRPIDYRTLSYAHRTPPGATTEIYLLAYNDKADSVSLGFSLHSLEDFSGLAQQENLLLGAFYGAVVLMLLLSLLVGFLMRQGNAFKYAAFLFSTLIMWLMLNGYGFQYVWPESVYWHNEGFHLSFLFFVFCSLEFSRGFLQLGRLAPAWNKVFIGVQLVTVAAGLMRLVGFYEPVLHIAYLLLCMPGLLIVPASWIAWRRGLQYAVWSLVAWLIYAFGLQSAIISAYTDNLQWGMDALFLAQAGSLMETLFLLLAMAKWLVAMESDRKLAHAMAHEDELTGLGNRRRLQNAYSRHLRRFDRNQQPSWLIMIDVDRFKQINDEYGHDAGDAVLRHMGQLLLRTCRQQDVAVRYGGEEFALLLQAGSAEDAFAIAERIRLDFANQPTLYDNQIIEHTLCCGVTEVLSPQLQLDSQEMMRRADAALYQAKAAGRNQSYVYQAGDSLRRRESEVGSGESGMGQPGAS